MKYEPLEKLNAEAAAAAEAAQAEKRARASGSCRILSLKQEERRIKKEAAEQARAAKAARAAAALEHRAARAAAPRAAPRAAAGRGPVVDEQPAVAMEEEDAEEEEEEEEEDPVDEASDEDDLEAELLAEQGPPLLLPLPDPTERMRLHPDARALEVPGDIHAKLKPYQVEGVAFLHRRWCQRPLRAGEARGCVLGDDMVRCCAIVLASKCRLTH